jgi:hypothetical protein
MYESQEEYNQAEGDGAAAEAEARRDEDLDRRAVEELEKAKINEHVLKISSAGVNLPEGLEQGHRYLITTEADVYEITEKDNQDGTIDKIYKVKQTGVVTVNFDGGKVIKAKEKGSVSRSLHGAIWYYHNEQGYVEPFDDYYHRIGKKMAAYMPEIIRFLESKS